MSKNSTSKPKLRLQELKAALAAIKPGYSNAADHLIYTCILIAESAKIGLTTASAEVKRRGRGRRGQTKLIMVKHVSMRNNFREDALLWWMDIYQGRKLACSLQPQLIESKSFCTMHDAREGGGVREEGGGGRGRSRNVSLTFGWHRHTVQDRQDALGRIRTRIPATEAQSSQFDSRLLYCN
jgi:hypothetical protein